MELNNDKFIIERSTDSKVFYTIASINGAGDHSGRLLYSFIDQTAPSGSSYYRLSQFDYDGSKKSFEVIRVIRHLEKPEITIIQNPGSTTRIMMQVPQQDWFFQLYNKAGSLIYQTHIPATEIHANILDINGLNLSPGLHVITLRSKNQSWSGKLLVSR